MRAYVQQGQPGDHSYPNWEQIAYGFWERGYEVIRFDIPQLDDGFLDTWLLKYLDETIVAGGVGTVKRALTRAQKPQPPIIDLPESLRTWIGRNFWTSTLGEIRHQLDTSDNWQPVHVKPLLHGKRFTGIVVNELKDLIASASAEDDTPVLVQEVVPFISEWRAYILRGKILNVSNYNGDPLLFPNPDTMQEALAAFKDRPIACSMDWGVTSDNRTLLVEANDGFSLGNYGLRRHLYTALIEARWRELVGLPDNLVGEKL